MNLTALSLLLLQAPGAGTAPPDSVALPAVQRPFAVGETFEYDGKLGILKLGDASISVARIDTVQGRPAYVFRFQLTANTIVFDMDDVMYSWTGMEDLVSYRFSQDFNEDGKIRERTYEIFPDSGVYRETERGERGPTVAAPLDDAAFFYFIRVTPLEVGKTYTYNRYFKRDKNPVTIRVEKRESCELPGGVKTTCLLLRPLLEAERNGMFSKRADARIWLTDDERRIPVQIRSRLAFGTVTLKIRSIQLGDAGAPAPAN